MWGKRGLALLSALGALAAGSGQAAGQMLETVNVQIINQSFDPVEIRVVDEVCNVVVFEGQLLGDTSAPVSLCPDRQQRAQMTIYDASGRAHRYRNLGESEIFLSPR